MKIAISSSGQGLDSQVDPRFGRAAYFIIIETESMDYEAVSNSNVSESGGAGIGAAKSIIDKDIKAVLTGNCGPNAQRTLNASDIKLYTNLSGTVAEAAELFKSGKLIETNESNVKPHFSVENPND